MRHFFSCLSIVLVVGLVGCETTPELSEIDRKDECLTRASSDALANLVSLATRGNAKALHSLGLAFETGDGVPIDYSEAYKCYYLASWTEGGGGPYSFALFRAVQHSTRWEISRGKRCAEAWLRDLNKG